MHKLLGTIIILLTLAGAVTGNAQEGLALPADRDGVPEIVWNDITGARYTIPATNPNLMILVVDMPLMADRLKSYGKVNIKKDGTREVDTQFQGAVTPAGMSLYQALMMVKNEKGAFKIFSVTLEHARAGIIKYDRYEWSELIPDIEKALANLPK